MGFIDSARGALKRSEFILRDKAPVLLIAAHVGLDIATIVLAIRASKKVEAIMDECDTEIQAEIREHGNEIDISDRLKKIRWKHRKRILKEIAWPATTGIVSGGCLFAALKIFDARYSCLMAAYTAKTAATGTSGEPVSAIIDEGLTRLGEQPPEDQQQDDAEKPKSTGYQKSCSEYWILFDESCDLWSKEYGAGYRALKSQVAFMNNELVLRKSKYHPGFYTLNEMFRVFGFNDYISGEPLSTDDGQVLGVTLYDDPKVGEQFGSVGKIDIGLDDMDQDMIDFREGRERNVILRIRLDAAPIVGRGGVFRNRIIDNGWRTPERR